MSVQCVASKIQNLVAIHRVLLSLSDKTGLSDICKILTRYDCQLVATTSTYKAIVELGYKCQVVDSITNFPEILGGRVKTLHPKIFGRILGRTGLESDVKDMHDHHIEPFDLVICNLYPFSKVC